MAGDSTYSNSWILTLGYRFLKSDRHYRGAEEEEIRQEEGSEVINKTNSMDISVAVPAGKRWSFAATLPLVHSTRSSLYEHGYDSDADSNTTRDPDDRFTTKAMGIGDLRFTAYFRMLDPEKHKASNLIAGLGLKIPTGNPGATDVFYKATGPDEQVVDQSIQPGDGGWAVNAEFQAFTELKNGLGIYASGFYLFNPMDTNQVDRGRGTYGRNRYLSVADQFLVRGGLFLKIKKTGLMVNLGGRLEGVPSGDLIGKDSGFRRPGYAISAEPGISLQKHQHSFELNVPVALYRNRTQSYTDKLVTAETGTYTIGDAAFADYLVLLTYSVKFRKKDRMTMAH